MHESPTNPAVVHESLAPRITRIVLTLGGFAIVSFLLMRAQPSNASQSPASPLIGIALLAIFAIATLLLGNDIINLQNAWLKRRKSLLSPWATVIWSLLCIVFAMTLLAATLLIMRML